MRKDIIKKLKAEIKLNREELNCLLATNTVITTLSYQKPENRTMFQKMIFQREIFKSIIELLNSDMPLGKIAEELTVTESQLIDSEEYEMVATFVKWRKEIERLVAKPGGAN